MWHFNNIDQRDRPANTNEEQTGVQLLFGGFNSISSTWVTTSIFSVIVNNFLIPVNDKKKVKVIVMFFCITIADMDFRFLRSLYWRRWCGSCNFHVLFEMCHIFGRATKAIIRMMYTQISESIKKPNFIKIFCLSRLSFLYA